MWCHVEVWSPVGLVLDWGFGCWWVGWKIVISETSLRLLLDWIVLGGC